MDERTPGIRPRPSLGRLLDVAARMSFPGAATALLVLVAAGPLGLPGQPQLQWALVLGSVFFWSLFRPLSLPPLLVFALGVLADLLGYGPVGVGVLILLIVHGLTVGWRGTVARQGFMLIWLIYAGEAVGATALQWVLMSVLSLRLLPCQPVLFEMALAVGLYPLLAVALGRAHLTVAEPARA